MTATSESGRRKSWRCWRIVASTPWYDAMFDLTTICANGSGWTRNRYHASFCASKPHPCSCTPAIMSVKSLTSVVMLMMGVGGGVCVPSWFAFTLGNHPRKLLGFASVTTCSSAPPRLMRCPWSSLWAGSDGFATFVAVGKHTSPPRPPSDDVTMPTCMSVTGANSGAPVGHVPSARAVAPVGLPLPSTQLGLTSRWIISGTAFASRACLSPIDAELSIMKSRSTLVASLRTDASPPAVASPGPPPAEASPRPRPPSPAPTASGRPPSSAAPPASAPPSAPGATPDDTDPPHAGATATSAEIAAAKSLASLLIDIRAPRYKGGFATMAQTRGVARGAGAARVTASLWPTRPRSVGPDTRPSDAPRRFLSRSARGARPSIGDNEQPDDSSRGPSSLRPLDGHGVRADRVDGPRDRHVRRWTVVGLDSFGRRRRGPHHAERRLLRHVVGHRHRGATVRLDANPHGRHQDVRP